MERLESRDRREFLLRGLAMILGTLALPRPGGAACPTGVLGRIRFPGETVRWTGGAGNRKAWFVHRRNGREVGRRAVEAVSGGTPLVGWPIDGVLTPGEHEFLLEVGPVSLECGGYRVNPYRFGC